MNQVKPREENELLEQYQQFEIKVQKIEKNVQVCKEKIQIWKEKKARVDNEFKRHKIRNESLKSQIKTLEEGLDQIMDTISKETKLAEATELKIVEAKRKLVIAEMIFQIEDSIYRQKLTTIKCKSQ